MITARARHLLVFARGECCPMERDGSSAGPRVLLAAAHIERSADLMCSGACCCCRLCAGCWWVRRVRLGPGLRVGGLRSGLVACFLGVFTPGFPAGRRSAALFAPAVLVWSGVGAWRWGVVVCCGGGALWRRPSVAFCSACAWPRWWVNNTIFAQRIRSPLPGEYFIRQKHKCIGRTSMQIKALGHSSGGWCKM